MISDSLQAILDGFKSCGIDCQDVYQRAEVLQVLKDHGCDINNGNYREAWIEHPEADKMYMCPSFFQDGDVTCYGTPTFYQSKNKNSRVLSPEAFFRAVSELDEQEAEISAPDLSMLDLFLFQPAKEEPACAS